MIHHQKELGAMDHQHENMMCNDEQDMRSEIVQWMRAKLIICAECFCLCRFRDAVRSAGLMD